MSKLFQPIQIGNMEVKNRFVRSATHDWLGNPDGSISPQQVELYEKLAANDVGLIITAHAYIEHPRGKASLNQNGIYDDNFISGYQKLAKTVHKYGSKLVVQISHAGSLTTLEFTEGETPLNLNNMTNQEIEKIIEAYVQAANRAKLAGCDGVQLHLAHGYFLSRFISPDTNKRQDQWGGSRENRVRIVGEIIKRIQALVGVDFPILVKLNSTGGFEGTGAISLEDVVYTAQALEDLGVCAIEVSGGVGGEKKNSLSRTGVLSPEQEAYFAENAQEIKKAVSIPVILVGGLRSRLIIEKILDEGIANMISMSRPFVREPDLVRKLKESQDKVTCISCNKCRVFTGIKCFYKD
ncbi:MAG: NADH peroxidase [Clostridiaceae bacterium BRH_c20a]|nr:MAG: NADH peroxidase [Clostridiaceae bacterium BRH_c20a]